MENAKKMAVVGLGVSGMALLRYFVKQGIPALGFEEVSRENFDKAQKEFEGTPITLFFQTLPLKEYDQICEFVQSPGVPLTRPWSVQANEKNIPVTGELEFAARQLKGQPLVVTGTNGKSTTVSLIYAIFENAKISSSLKGNIGAPLITALTESPKEYYVIEASSYQLETLRSLHPSVAVVMNVTADHLDRYADMEAYAQAKEKVGQNQGPKDTFIYNADDRACLAMAKRSKAHTLPFSLTNHFGEGGFVTEDHLVVRLRGKEFAYPLKDCALKGLHNQENMLAALLVAHVCEVPQEVILKTLTTFKGLKHRLEWVGRFREVDFYDDSKGTNVGSVVMSLASFDKNVILILGGRDKGGDYSPLKSLIRHKVKTLIVMGEARSIIAQALAGCAPLVEVTTMSEALKECARLALPGDTVLLSPACSSFDQYQNYAQRGDDFAYWAKYYFEPKDF